MGNEITVCLNRKYYIEWAEENKAQWTEENKAQWTSLISQVVRPVYPA